MDKVSVLMAVYNPNLDFFAKQLESINNQTYSNIELLLYDDCISNRVDQDFVKKIMTKIPFRFLPYGDKNLGYEKAFATLLAASDGQFVAFSDQDDIWKLDKIEKCMTVIKKDKTLLVSTDRCIINENDEIVINSSRANSNQYRASWKTGDDIAKYHIFRDFVAGNCMLANGDFARSTLPISNYSPHDTWVVACAAIEGKLSLLDESLTCYRRHSQNVSGVMNGVESKQDYYQYRVYPQCHFVDDLMQKYPDFKDKDEVLAFSRARKNKNVFALKKYSYLEPEKAKFEIMLALTPNFLFKILKYFAKKLSK